MMTEMEQKERQALALETKLTPIPSEEGRLHMENGTGAGADVGPHV
jgi:hypothetical protein